MTPVSHGLFTDFKHVHWDVQIKNIYNSPNLYINILYIYIQGGPLLVINGVITPINGLITG